MKRLGVGVLLAISMAWVSGCPSGTESDQTSSGGGGAMAGSQGGATTVGQSGPKTGGALEMVTCSSVATESCMIATLGQCQAHVGSLGGFETTCKSMNGVFAKGPCPTDGRVGGCAVASVLFSYYAPLTTAGIEQICAGKGSYCAPAGTSAGGADAGAKP